MIDKDRGSGNDLCLRFFQKVRSFTPFDWRSGIQQTCQCRCPPLPAGEDYRRGWAVPNQTTGEKAWHSIYSVISAKIYRTVRTPVMIIWLGFRTFKVLKKDNVLGLLTGGVTCDSAVSSDPLLQRSLMSLASLLMLMPKMFFLPPCCWLFWLCCLAMHVVIAAFYILLFWSLLASLLLLASLSLLNFLHAVVLWSTSCREEIILNFIIVVYWTSIRVKVCRSGVIKSYIHPTLQLNKKFRFYSFKKLYFLYLEKLQINDIYWFILLAYLCIVDRCLDSNP